MSPLTRRKRLPFAAVFLALLVSAWIRVDAATLPPGTIASASVDVDGDGDLDFVAVDRSLALFIWENDGADRLELKHPGSATFRSPNAPHLSDDPQDDPDDNSDQGDSPSVGSHRRPDPVIAQESRALAAAPPAAPQSEARSSCPPRAPPLRSFVR
jgi:hypothetical protein